MATIKNELDTNKLNLIIKEGILADLTKSQPIEISIERVNQTKEPIGNFLVITKKLPNSTRCENSYFLPWKANSGLYIDLPTDNPDANLFFTDGLSGCCLGLQKMENKIRICHYNSQPEKFDINDFQRYNNATQRKWLIPEGYLQTADFQYYSTLYREKVYYDSLYWTYFWGEYDNNNKVWDFYYQSNDKIINKFNLS